MRRTGIPTRGLNSLSRAADGVSAQSAQPETGGLRRASQPEWPMRAAFMHSDDGPQGAAVVDGAYLARLSATCGVRWPLRSAWA